MGIGKLAVEALSAGAYLIDDFAGDGLRALGFSSPEAVEKLAKAGTKNKFGRAARTIEGPLPPPSVRSPMDQQQFDPVMPSREEAIMSGSTRYMEGDELMLNRNYGAEYAPLGQARSVTNRQSETQGIRGVQALQQTDPTSPDFKEGRLGFQEIGDNPDVTYEAHHRAGLKMYDWAFKGLDEQGQAEMRALLESMGVFTGDSPYNRMDLPNEEVHRPLHSTLRYGDNQNLEYLGDKLLERYPNWESKSVKERAGLIKHFVKTVQRYADTETYRMMSSRRALRK